MIRFLFVAGFVILFLVLSIPILIVEWVIGKFNKSWKDKSSLAIVKWAFRVCLFFAGVKVTVIGEENVPKDRSVLYVMNHRSYFDILLTYVRVPGLTGYIAKSQMLRYPLLRDWMRNVHCLFLDRTDLKKGMATIKEAIDKEKNGISVNICPEGTRNKTGEDLLPFHDGSFKIAEKAGCPIVPVTMVGTNEIFEDHLPKIIPTHVVLEYGKPIDVQGLSREEKKELSNNVRDIILSTYLKNKKLRAENAI